MSASADAHAVVMDATFSFGMATIAVIWLDLSLLSIGLHIYQTDVRAIGFTAGECYLPYSASNLTGGHLSTVILWISRPFLKN